MMLKIVLFRTVIGPVTPAIQSGWAPNTENMKEAMNDERRTSDTPYCCVVSIRSRENAMPGNTLRIGLDRASKIRSLYSLGKENENYRRDHSIVPRI